MQLSQKLISQPNLRRCLLVLGAAYALTGAAADAQNFDQGKSATKLFADNCTECHANARGLAGGRSPQALFQFLQEHYVSNTSSAGQLASYLASVDIHRRARPRPGAAKPSRPATSRPPVRSAKPAASTL